MLDNLYRDEATMPVVRALFSGFRDYLSASSEALLRGRRCRGRARDRVRAAVGHALGFATWQSLTRHHGLGDPQAADLMARLVAVAERPPDS